MTPWTEHDYHEYFNERAGIAEHDGGLTRTQAEAQARRETVEKVLRNRTTETGQPKVLFSQNG